ncbi:MAG: archease [Dehalococcoidia bacterium]|nr:archease [Dehalococcoidia bacterium]
MRQDGELVEIGRYQTSKMDKPFKIIDHTADVGVIAFGADMEHLFSNVALALFGLITDTESIAEKLQRDLKINSEDRDSLLVEWLNELIYLFDTEQILFNRFEIESLSHRQLKATCYGEKFDPSRHKIERGVKAATYHMLKVDKYNDGYMAQVIFDI